MKPLTEKGMIYILISILIITTLADLFTALRNPGLFELAETNPIYLATGSPIPLTILNVLVVIWFARSIKKPISMVKIFTFCILLIYLSVGHTFGAWSNLYATEQYNEDPEEFIATHTAISDSERVSNYMLIVGIVMVAPIVISISAFALAMFFYDKRMPRRDKIVMQIYKLSTQLVRK